MMGPEWVVPQRGPKRVVAQGGPPRGENMVRPHWVFPYGGQTSCSPMGFPQVMSPNGGPLKGGN